MYLAADPQVLRLEANGTFTRILGSKIADGVYGIGGPARDGSADGPNGLAFDSQGDLYVAGSAAKNLLMVTPNGTLRLSGQLYPRGYGGLVATPDGTVIAMDTTSVVKISPHGIENLIGFPGYKTPGFHSIHGFLPDGIALAPNGTIYLDTYWGNGYADKSAIAAITPDGNSKLFWEQNPPRTDG
jgi:sugar lactone lactonase YvrE